MRRRSFLTAIAAAFVAPDPERLLWTPEKKLISIPAPKRVQAYKIIDVTTHSARGPWRGTVRALIDKGSLRVELLPL